MPIPPSVARTFTHLLLPDAEVERLRHLVYADEGHGYDVFGMHPAFVAMGSGLLGPFHGRYFRVRSQGAHHIPRVGPAILAGNHSGTLPVDAMMLWADVLRQTDPPRVARPVADYFVPMLPVMGEVFARGGMVGGSRGNARKLLEAGNLLMIFPEGVPGISKPFRDRYRLQEWRVGHAELAIRHGCPVVPLAIIGAEEQMPQIGQIRGISLFGAPHLPIPAVPFPLPVRYHILYGAPVPLHEEHRPEEADDPSVVRAAANRVRDAVAELIREGLSQRKGVFA